MGIGVTALFAASCERQQAAQQVTYTQPQPVQPVSPPLPPPTISQASIDVTLSCAAIAPEPPVESQPEPEYQPSYQQPYEQPYQPELQDDNGKKPDDYGEASLLRASYPTPAATAGETEPARAPLIATSLGMIREDGSAIRFADETRVRPALSAEAGTGRYGLTIHYQPQPGELVGQPLVNADRFVAVSLNLGPVLARQRLRCDRLTTLTYRINGAEIASIGDIPLGTGETRFDLPADFRTASSRVAAG